jgi:beta-lactamase class A
MSLSALGSNRRRVRLPLLEVLSVLLLLAALLLFVVELIGFSQSRDRLQTDITVAQIPVGGLSAVEAQTRWEQAYAQPIQLNYQGSPILLDPASMGFRTNSETMLAEAIARSSDESNFWLTFWNYLWRRPVEPINVSLSAQYQESLVRSFLNDIAARYDRPPGAPQPVLETLTFEPGTPGYTLDVDAAMALVDQALRDPYDRLVDLPVTQANPIDNGLQALRDMIVAYLDSQGFIYDGQTTVAAVYIQDLTTGEEINLNGDVAFSAASTVKIPIMLALYKYRDFALPQDEAWLLVNSLLCSNNSSSNLLMDQVIGEGDIFAGLQYVTDNIRYLGARNTFITAPLDLGIEGQVLGSNPIPQTHPNPRFNTDPDPYNQATAEDLGTLLMMIYDCATQGSGLMTAYPNGEYNQTECQQMLNVMSANDLERLLQAGIPAGVRIAHKNGWLQNVHADAGIVFPPNGRNYIITAFVWEAGEFFDYNRAWPLIEEISRAAWNYFSPEQAELSRRTDLPVAAQSCDLFRPPSLEETNLNDINAWRTDAGASAETSPGNSAAGG